VCFSSSNITTTSQKHHLRRSLPPHKYELSRQAHAKHKLKHTHNYDVTMSDNDSSSNGPNSGTEPEEDVARRRSKNRVNAKRSRERKRLVLDTLQQDYWRLQQANKKMKTDNGKLRDAINSLEALKQTNHSPPSPPPLPPAALVQQASVASSFGVSPTVPTTGGTVAQTASVPSNPARNPFVELLAQQILLQESQARMNAGLNNFPNSDMLTLHGLSQTRDVPGMHRGTVTPDLPSGCGPLDGLFSQVFHPAALAQLIQNIHRVSPGPSPTNGR
jgi:hypothetical protein